MSDFFNHLVQSFIIFTLIVVLYILGLVQYKKWKNDPLIIDEEFQSLFQSFKKDAKKYKVNAQFTDLTITFSPFSLGQAAATCYPALNTIYVSREELNVFDESGKKVLIYHELGHCVLGRLHETHIYKTENLNCPKSIMFPYLDPTVNCYAVYEDLYIEELFTNLP
jgi:hypothetical protein